MTHTPENDVAQWQHEVGVRLGRGDHWPTTPVQCVCGWRETDADAGTWVEHMTGAIVSTRRTDWGVRDDATGNVGTVGAYNRAATEEWLAELSDPSTLMRRQRTTYRDHVTEWVVADTPIPSAVTDDGTQD